MSSPFMGFSIQHGKGAVLKGHIRLGPVCVLGSGVPHFPIPHSFQVLQEKRNQHCEQACLLMGAWSAEKSPGSCVDFRFDQTWLPKSSQSVNTLDFCLSLLFLQTLGPLISFFSFFFNLKRGFGPHCQVSHLPRDCGCRYRIRPREAGLLKFFLSFLYVFCFLHLFDCTVERIQVSWKEKHGDQVQEIASE